ncbi:PREDICTED: odorant receptor 49b-like [Acromyrmex echinatior]|uniref:odorant receptor 49b-like n=1 Tax=Acromyrmex echinatior TaxID=103372 RepID=UPI0005810D61|nr:PREDICTED: odorant receptor 49b-like [Acromyrmex echinatior]
MYSFTFSQFMDVVLNVDNPDDFTNTLYTMLTMFAADYKIFDLFVNHESFAKLIQNLTEGTFKPLLLVEIEIQRKFDKIIQNLAKCYTILIMITYIGHVLISLLINFKKRQLTFRGWIPYNYSSFMLFCLTYAHQYVGVILACLVSVACDSLIIGLLLHVCCQIMILQYRLKSLINDQNTLRDCVRQHRHIIKFAYAINKRFTRIIAFQFVANFIAFFAYTLCILVQIFIYCWFGNKLKLMSLQLVDSIFEIEWIPLDLKTKKSLLVIMTRAMKPIEFNSAYILNMNLDSFVALLKTSYSAYNLLSQVQE